MDITNQTGQIDEELNLLKTEINQVLHNVQENVFNAQDPFSEMPSVRAGQDLASPAESQHTDVSPAFVASGGEEGFEAPAASPEAEGESSVLSVSEGSGEGQQASPEGLSEFLSSAGGLSGEATESGISSPVDRPDTGPQSNLNPGIASSEAIEYSSGEPQSEAISSDEMNANTNAAEEPAQAMTESAFASGTGLEASANETAGPAVEAVQQELTISEPQMAITSENLEMDPQASIDAMLAQQAAEQSKPQMAVTPDELEIDPQAAIDAMLAQQAATQPEDSPPDAVPEAPTNFQPDIADAAREAGTKRNGNPAGEFIHAGNVVPTPTSTPAEPFVKANAPEATTRKPERRHQQDVFSRAALTYALSPSQGSGHTEQRAGDESMDLITIAGLAQWAHSVLQRFGNEYLMAILEISQLTGRISKETQEVIIAISPLLESASTEKGVPAKQIVSMLAQLDAFLGTVSASDSRLLPFLLQDDMEVFPLIRP